MAIFFMTFEVVPTEHNSQFAILRGAYAHCWLDEDSEVAAVSKARFRVSQDEWQIAAITTSPREVTPADFEDRDIGLAQFLKAQDQGIAVAYVGWARDGKTSAGPLPFERSRKFDLNAYVGRQKKLTKKGRCLHFQSGEQCGSFISAHSIQRNGQLSAIAHNGHVYSISRNVGTLKASKGRPTLEKIGIGKVSTFFGFCDKHDNELFLPIDSAPLKPSEEQALLYAYRSICRELFVRLNALRLVDELLGELPATSAARQFYEELKSGLSAGLDNLCRHKGEFDTSLSERRTDVEYVLSPAISSKPWHSLASFFQNSISWVAGYKTSMTAAAARTCLRSARLPCSGGGASFLLGIRRAGRCAQSSCVRSLQLCISKTQAEAT